jgi:glutathionyl-hydroquinone reductase
MTHGLFVDGEWQTQWYDAVTGGRFVPTDPIFRNWIAAEAKPGLSHYTGRASVPVLWDQKRRTIVNNESSDIIRMLNSAFANFTDDRTGYYPIELREEIDRINDLVSVA